MLCASGAAAGLAGGYLGTILASDPESTPSSTFAEEILGSDQAFPPSEDWPGSASSLARDVLFEEDASRTWAAETPTPRRRRSESWSAATDVQVDGGRADDERVDGELEPSSETREGYDATEPELVTQFDEVDDEAAAWKGVPAEVMDEPFNDAALDSAPEAAMDAVEASATEDTVGEIASPGAFSEDVEGSVTGTKAQGSGSWPLLQNPTLSGAEGDRVF
ncbi:MAG: hypothetical protein ACFB5Z_00265 [Elainellaceae cyanobacterium]